MLFYEILLLAGAAACVGLARKGRWSDVLLILLWAHLSLGAVRHVPVFLLVAAPRIAAQFSEWWRALVDSTARRSLLRTFDELSSDLIARFSWNSVWLALPVLLLIFLDKPINWPRQFPESRYPNTLI
jgi:ABC-type spermidine/putrescine transport system permease subunit I